MFSRILYVRKLNTVDIVQNTIVKYHYQKLRFDLNFAVFDV